MLVVRGRISYGCVFKNSATYTALIRGTLNLPDPASLPVPDNFEWENYTEEPSAPYSNCIRDK